jgi:hypothetical protein
VGVGLTVVGAVTGNTDLMKIGGYVGLAGGVTGLAISGVNMAFSTAATQVASSATSGAAQGAESAATSGAANAATSATGQVNQAAISQAVQGAGEQVAQQTGASGLLSTAGTTGAANTAASVTPAVTGAVQNAGVSAVKTAADATVSGVQNAATTGVGETVAGAQNAGSNVVAQGTSFFDKLSKLDSVMNIGGEVLKGMASGGALDKQNELAQQRIGIDQQLIDLKRDQFGYDKMAQERAYQNANTQGRLNVRTRELTPEEKAAAAAKKQQNMAQPYTPPAR